MKPVHEVRGALSLVDGALVPFTPERAEQGDLAGARTLWNPSLLQEDRLDKRSDLIAQADDAEDGDAEAPGNLEELVEFAPPSEADLVAALGGKAKIDEILRSRLVSSGVDALGWYVSFHQTGIQWGIYLPVSGLVITALGVFGGLPCDLLTKLTLAFRLIHQHEIFHFAADYASAQLELLCGRPVWVPVRAKLRGSNGYRVHEEQLANAWMQRSLWRGRRPLRFRGRSEAVLGFVRLQPEGYRDSPEVTAAPLFFREVDRLVRDSAEASGAFRSELLRSLDGVRLVPFSPYLDWRACPVHVVHDEQRLSLPPFEIDLLQLARGVTETDGFMKDLARLDAQVQRAWPRTKEKILVDTTLPGLDFKHFDDKGERVYSVRVSKAVRAHLRPVRTRPGCLEAFRVGGHKEMGHG